MYTEDNFSPYLDPEPIAAFFDDVGQRGMVTGFLAVLVHVGIFTVLQMKMPVPHIPLEPETIQIEIVSFEPELEPKPEPELEPDPELRPLAAPPSQAPMPTPRPPDPKPQESTPPPPPAPKPEPEPELAPVVIPPAPQIITAETPEPEIVLETPPKPEPEAMPVEAVEPLALFDPALLTPSEPELPPEPVTEIIDPEDQPVRAPQPVPLLFDPNLLEPDTQAQDLPNIEDISELPPAPVVEPEAAPGIIEPEPELAPDIIPEPVAPPTPIFEPEVLDATPVTSEPEIELEITPDIEIAAPPPSILAAPDAPTTQDEAEQAVPQSQATPLDLILKDRGNTGAPPRRPTRPTGGGNEDNIPVAGGTPKSSPGASGWQLPSGLIPAEGMLGGKGLIRDIRCREERRTHQDCPEYVNKHRGRNADGLESFGPHIPLGTSIQRSRGRPVTRSLEDTVNPTFGDASLPSTTVMDDVGGFRGQYLGDKIGTPGRSRRLRDLFNPPDAAPWTTQPDLAPPPEDEEKDEAEEEDGGLIILKDPE